MFNYPTAKLYQDEFDVYNDMQSEKASKIYNSLSEISLQQVAEGETVIDKKNNIEYTKLDGKIMKKVISNNEIKFEEV